MRESVPSAPHRIISPDQDPAMRNPPLMLTSFLCRVSGRHDRLVGRRLIDVPVCVRRMAHESVPWTWRLIHSSTAVTKREARSNATSASETATGSHL